MPIVRIAAMSDVHITKTSQGSLAPYVAQLTDHADILVLCGDLTDYGLPEEGRVLVKELAALRMPIIAVLGNHDYETDHQVELGKILTDGGMVLLDGESYESHGIGFAGVKGFCGGFGRGVLGSWGEPAVKAFVKEAVDEALKLETSLARLRTPHKIGVLHYAPCRATVEGEPLEIFPYLGCGRLEEPLTRYHVDVVFHGHAHNGTLEGHLANGTPVYNVALPLFKRRLPDQPPFRIVEIDTDTPGPGSERERSYQGMERRRRNGVPGDGVGSALGSALGT
jgi:Icc-related predicted phosphoesterase